MATTGGPASSEMPPNFNPNIQYENLPKLPSLAKSHGIIMGLVFIVIMPLGSVLIRSSRNKNTVWFHAACQLVGWVMMFGGLATGIKMAKIIDRLHNNAHTVLGTVVIAGLILQPIFGSIHHRKFKSNQTHTIWTHIHVWYGRVLILLGIINGGLGLQLARSSPAYSKPGLIVYSVLAGLVGLALLGLFFWVGKSKRHHGSDKAVTEGSNRATAPA
ncbi:hypothetical protein jhhlp_000536 [Lomentospora prolificans]|uniref:Cytochrome b561 domain-containing protein n=1 Tax=Lomentospora prolificans TaxID=41688 RepID=A0A2N3NLB8_9PEZI|nr:hypothetical protein jhhlp_000536 [Lomentospora prolificans]